MPARRPKRRIPRDETAGGLPAFLADLGRHTGGVLDVGASMGVEVLNQIPRGLAAIEATTPFRKLGPNMNFPVMDPARDDVASWMNTAPQFKNPFPISAAGKQKMQSMGQAIENVIQSEGGQDALQAESDLEEYVNEKFGKEFGGAVFSIIAAGIEVAGPQGKVKLRPQANLTKADRIRLAKVDEKFPGVKALTKYLTPDEARAITTRNAQGVLDVWDQLDPSEMASVALAGRSKRGWYAKSSKALVDLFGDEDALRFSGLLAALSPQTSVESNLKNALNTWVNWDKAGRPTDPDSIRRIMGQSVEGSKGEASVMDAWLFNSIDALSAPDASLLQLSGAKVDSFMQNIWGNLSEVTNDAWIAKYTGLDQGKFSTSRGKNVKGEVIKGKKAGVYVGINAATRKAADLLTKRTGEKWTPAEIQETVWSWSKVISEKANTTNTPISELINDLTNAEITETPDFGTLLGETKATIAGPRVADNQYQQILQRGGLGERVEALAAGNRGETTVPHGTSASGTGIQPRHLDAAAQRLEAARRSGQKPKAIEDLRTSVDRYVSGGASPAFTRRAAENNRGNLSASYSLPADRIQRLNSLGVSTPAVTELRPTPRTAAKFTKAIEAAKATNEWGAQVTAKSAKEYENMRLFLTEDGKAGFALDGQDIVSLFNHGKSPHQGISTELVLLAVEQGGRTLDNYDTFLSVIYKKLGFQEVNRFPWDEGQKPKDWSYEQYRKFNNGKPDYVFMEYRPTTKLTEQMATKSNTLNMPNQPQAPTDVDISRFDDRLRQTIR